MMVSSISEPSGTDANGKSYWDSESAVTIMESVYNRTFEKYGAVKTRNLTQLKTSEVGEIKNWEMWRLK